MRKKPLILVAYLLMLYIAPMIFISSYSHATTPTEQDLSKDFSISADWYNTSWLYRKSITIEQDTGLAGTDYQVLVEVAYDSDMQADFADIRFVDDDHETLLDHWLETANATWGIFWVEVKDYISAQQDATIYMYYGNDAASSTSNGTATFLFYEDWSSQTVDADRWDIVTSAGSVAFSAVDADHGYVIQVGANTGTAIYHLETDTDYSDAPYALMMRSHIEKTAAVSQSIRCGMGNVATGGNRYYVDTTAGTQDFISVDADIDVDTSTIPDGYYDAWFRFEIQLLETGGSLYADFVHVTDTTHDNVTTAPYAAMFVRDSEYDLYNDWFASRKFVVSDPYVSAFGEEEDNLPPPEWEPAGTAIIVFFVPVFTGALDALLIFLGLIMIPASTLYLVKGGKDEMSTDKLFYVIIVFVMGWALFLGGIYG